MEGLPHSESFVSIFAKPPSGWSKCDYVRLRHLLWKDKLKLVDFGQKFGQSFTMSITPSCLSFCAYGLLRPVEASAELSCSLSSPLRSVTRLPLSIACCCVFCFFPSIISQSCKQLIAHLVRSDKGWWTCFVRSWSMLANDMCGQPPLLGRESSLQSRCECTVDTCAARQHQPRRIAFSLCVTLTGQVASEALFVWPWDRPRPVCEKCFPNFWFAKPPTVSDFFVCQIPENEQRSWSA